MQSIIAPSVHRSSCFPLLLALWIAAGSAALAGASGARAASADSAAASGMAAAPSRAAVDTLPETVVQGDRAVERKSAVAFTELSRPTLQQRYWAQDVPMLLASYPGVYAYSDAGNGIGYSYVQIRGFAQRRISVTLNGVPENDPESHEVYWVDLPDLLASADNVQIQRGAGSALYGSSSLGGAINVETLAIPRERQFELSAGYGTYNTRRYSAQYQSGLIDSKYSLTARYSRILSDGYRDLSWSRLWSYYVSAARVDSRVTTRLNLYGGPENLHLAYYAVDRPTLEGGLTGDADADRKSNPLGWPGEQDNFNEPHYELLNDVKLSDAATLNSTLFFYPGEGYYDDLPYGPQSFSTLHLPNFEVDSDSLYPAAYYLTDDNGQPVRGADGRYTVIASDITQRLWVKDRHYGWVPRVHWAHGRGELFAGGEWREHDGRHFGELTWAQALPPGSQPDWRFYDYTGHVRVLSAFAQESYHATDALLLTGSLQLRDTRYAINDDPFNGYDFSLHYTFVNPRAGFNWNVSPLWNVFGVFAHSQAEPILSEIYSPDDPSSVPLFRVVDPANGVYQDPLVHPEKLNDYELGAGFRSGADYLKLNLYLMDFRDEIVPNGQVGKLGVPITGNAAQSRHEGLEAEGRLGFPRGFEISGNVTLSRNYFVHYGEFEDSATVQSFDGNAIALFPGVLANVTLGWRRGRTSAGVTVVGVGKQYLDNTEDDRGLVSTPEQPLSDSKHIDGHVTLDADAAVAVGRLGGVGDASIAVHGGNLTNQHYETSGYVDTEVPYFFPAALRNVFVSLKVAF